MIHIYNCPHMKSCQPGPVRKEKLILWSLNKNIPESSYWGQWDQTLCQQSPSEKLQAVEASLWSAKDVQLWSWHSQTCLSLNLHGSVGLAHPHPELCPPLVRLKAHLLLAFWPYPEPEAFIQLHHTPHRDAIHTAETNWWHTPIIGQFSPHLLW